MKRKENALKSFLIKLFKTSAIGLVLLVPIQRWLAPWVESFNFNIANFALSAVSTVLVGVVCAGIVSCAALIVVPPSARTQRQADRLANCHLLQYGLGILIWLHISYSESADLAGYEMVLRCLGVLIGGLIVLLFVVFPFYYSSLPPEEQPA